MAGKTFATQMKERIAPTGAHAATFGRETAPRTHLEIKVGPPRLAVHQGYTVLVCEPDGQIIWPSPAGLYFRDTRVISNWTIHANGEGWELLNGATPTTFTTRSYLTNRAFATEDGRVAEKTLGLVVDRHVDEGMHESIEVANYASKAVRFNLEIAVRCDFADVFEVKADHIVRRGRIVTTWSARDQRLDTTYRNSPFCRDVAITAYKSDAPAVYANGRISFELEIAPHGTWRAYLAYDLSDGREKWLAPREAGQVKNGHGRNGHGKNRHGKSMSKASQRLAAWRAQGLKIETGNEPIRRLFQQGLEDLAALRLPIDHKHEDMILPAGGLPWFIALFGRDSLITSLQTIFVHSGFARAALETLAAWQASETDDYRDAQPGKIPHELRLGELATLKLVPHTPYYGSADATPLYLIALHTAWRWTGDDDLVRRHLETAKRCLEWIDRYGDLDGDGFQEYITRSPAGLANQGWKDAHDALVHRDGSPVKAPIALCELQGYVYDAWLRMAEIYDAFGEAERAVSLRDKAARLFARFNEAFWNEDAGFYAFALDADKKQVTSIVSNPGQCLWSGIVPEDRARRVVERLMRPDMNSCWGIRTLSSDHPSFNPNSYHNGSVWPHDNGIIALGFKRYGHVAEAAQIARDIAAAGSFFMLNRLPELYAGMQRDATSFPVQYLGANVPQAWAAGSIFALLQSMLGLQPDAHRRMLYLDPTLPGWLDDFQLKDLRLGDQTLDLHFWRSGDKTCFTVTKGDPACVARRDYRG
jgi:glycogen debranching enzyme